MTELLRHSVPLFLLIILVINSSDVALSVLIYVGGCGWLVAMSVCPIEMTCVEFKNKSPNSDYAADDITDLIRVNS